MTEYGKDLISNADAVYFNFGNGYGQEVGITAPIGVREDDDGTIYAKSADRCVTMVAPGWLSVDVVPRSGE